MVVTITFLWDALQQLLHSLLYNLGLQGKEGSLVLLGLDNAGKTTLLHRLKTGGDIRPFPPTDRPALEEFTINTTTTTSTSSSSSAIHRGAGASLHFTAWDLGGHEAVRHLWQDYVSTQVSSILFLVDAADSERLEEAAYELDALVGEGLLQGIPVALLLNKCDLPEALTTTEICQRLEWTRLVAEHAAVGEEEDDDDSTRTRRSHKQKEQMAVFRISVLKGEGYQDAFRWISGFL